MYNFVYETPQSAKIKMCRITEIWQICKKKLQQISVILRILILRIVVFHTTISTLCHGNEYILHILYLRMRANRKIIEMSPSGKISWFTVYTVNLAKIKLKLDELA